MSYANYYRPAPPTYPMPNTGTILDASAGHYVKGPNDSRIMNGGVCMFTVIAALPNMFKSVLAAGMSGCVLRAFPKALAHPHDTETTMVQGRFERMARSAMSMGPGVYRVPENLMSEGRLFFTTSVDYGGTELFKILKQMAKDRWDKEGRIELEIINPNTGKPYEYFNPLIEIWDSLSGLKTDSAEEMLDSGNVGTKDLNMLAMRVNSGKSQIVEQLPDLTAKHGIYVIATAHVGQQYQLDPHTPNVKILKWLGGDVKLKRVPENVSFQTGNCYIVTHMSPMNDKGIEQWPWSPDEKDEKRNDLILLKVNNMRGKFGPSGIPHHIVVSQRDGWLPYMSNFMYLREAGKYGIVGNDRFYSLALMPDVKMQRTTVRTVFRDSTMMQRAALILTEMHWFFNRQKGEGGVDEKYHVEPEALYEEIKAKGYDWNLLLNTRFWHGPLNNDETVPFLSTLDILRMRVGEYHPAWYPQSAKEMGLEIQAVE